MFGLDEELLGFVAPPVLAVILLYPLTEESEERRREELERQPEAQMDDLPKSLFYMKQTIGNAGGTIALLHCLTNVCAAEGDVVSADGGRVLTIAKGAFLDSFMNETAGMTPEEIGEHLEAGKGCSGTLHELHGEAAQRGDTRAPGVDDEIDLHFVAFVEKDGVVWELDGRRAGPIQRGAVEGGLMRSVARVVREEYIAKRDGDISFNVMALVSAE